MEKVVLTIGGSDSWAGGGVATDIKTLEQHGVFGVMALTCIAVADRIDDFTIRPLDSRLLEEQLVTISDSYELSAIKIGLLGTEELVEVVSRFLDKQTCPIVLDPVLAFKETDERYNERYTQAISKLCQKATMITPNLAEANMLSGSEVHSVEDVKDVASTLYSILKVPVVIKGGTRLNTHNAVDVFYDGMEWYILQAEKLDKQTVNGAGCSFSSAIAANLARGFSLYEAVSRAKEFVHHSIEQGYTLKDSTGNVWYSGGAYDEK